MEKIQNKVAEKNNSAVSGSVISVMNAMLDGQGMRRRFDDLLGKRAPQFISSLVSLVNSDNNMKAAFYENPMSVIQSGLKAATFDLPIDQNLGYAYLVAFKNFDKESGTKKTTCTFVLGWKGMHQLAIRTGAYKTINVVDIREGELISYNRLTEDIKIEFIEDEEEREKKKVIGYVGYYRLVNGAEKTIYRTVKQIEQHEKKFRKGDYQGKGWRDDWDAMARKTVYRELIGKWGVMSIEYQNAKSGNDIANQIKEEFIESEYEPSDESVIAEVEPEEVKEETNEG